MEKWNEGVIVPFLDLFQTKPCLWNPDVPEYRSPDKRSEAIRWIIHKLGLKVTEMEIRCKIKNIRTTYLNSLKRVLRAREAGLGEEYVPTLLWYNKADSFMREHMMRSMNKKEQKRKEQQWLRRSARSLREAQALRDSEDETEIASEAFEQNSNDETRTTNGNETTKTSIDLTSQKNDAMDATESEEDSTDLRKSNNPIPQTSGNHSNSNRNVGRNGGSYANIGNHTSSTVQLGNSYANHTSGVQRGPDVDYSTRKRMRSSSIPDSQDGDEFDTFSKHVGNQLRKLPLERALKCQDAIHSLLMRERIESCQELTRPKMATTMVRPVQYSASSMDSNRQVLPMDNNTCAKEPHSIVPQSSAFEQNQQVFDTYSYALKCIGD